MELALSLGDSSKPFKFLDHSNKDHPKIISSNKDLGFSIELGARENQRSSEEKSSRISSDGAHPLQLDLLPFSPVPRRQIPFPWLTDNLGSEPGSTDGSGRGFDVNRLSAEEETEEGAAMSSPNSAASSFQMDFGMSRKRDIEGMENGRGSDDDENGLTRKKLRLSKEQSAFLEESFKEHNTLNPKQKMALAKHLNLRPRQVEVWFQNRRARTKLKQTEVDCEYLKRCCETLTEENRRLQKELQELRALKTSQPFFMQLPPTTLTMCPSCERVATTSAAATVPATKNIVTPAAAATTSTTLSLAKPRNLYPFSHGQQQVHHLPHPQQAHQAAS
ncbi:Homeobox-leucine zipper protein family [Euphorbia peplus]|nr:Homeobox-leucine zipper protein family [Euphorbia peplus]